MMARCRGLWKHTVTMHIAAENRLPCSSTVGRCSNPPRLIASLRERIRYLHYSLRTEQAYVYWARAFVRYNGMRHPRELEQTDVERFLAHLANERHVSVSTHKQALCAVLFLYREVLGEQLPWMENLGRPKSRVRVPTVLSREEVARLLAAIDGVHGLIARTLYGTGMRLMECLRLRTKDVDFDRSVIVVREGKGGKDRVVMLPEVLREPLRQQFACARKIWDCDRQAGYGSIRWAAYAAAFVRHAPARVGCRYPASVGVARTQRCEHDDDLHARTEGERGGDTESAGRTGNRLGGATYAVTPRGNRAQGNAVTGEAISRSV